MNEILNVSNDELENKENANELNSSVEENQDNSNCLALVLVEDRKSTRGKRIVSKILEYAKKIGLSTGGIFALEEILSAFIK